MYRRILTPTDGSVCSQLALDHGVRLAKEQQAEVRIVQVLDLQPLYESEMLDVEPRATGGGPRGPEPGGGGAVASPRHLIDGAEEGSRWPTRARPV